MTFGCTELKIGASEAKRSSEQFGVVHFSAAPQILDNIVICVKLSDICFFLGVETSNVANCLKLFLPKFGGVGIDF